MTSPILNGWKEIAAFLGVHVDTARRLAKEEGLPIAVTKGGVMASSNTLEAWVVSNSNGKRENEE